MSPTTHALPPQVWDLPFDVWMLVQAGLSQRDLASLARTCSRLRPVAHRALSERGARVSGDSVHGVCAHPAWRDLRGLRVDATRRYTRRTPPSPLTAPCMPRLERLVLRHPLFPLDTRFWATVFDRCPALAHVTTLGEFYVTNYKVDVRHFQQLIDLGIPRLRSLDVEGRGMVLSCTSREAVSSSTLRRYRAACAQVPAPVDARLEELEVEEPVDGNAPPTIARMGPLTRASTRRVRWQSPCSRFHASALSAFTALRNAELVVTGVATAAHMSRHLASLAHLPPCVRRLRVAVHACPTSDDSDMQNTDKVVWGRPLSHVHGLRTLEVWCTTAPRGVGALLAGWMGAGTRVAEVRATFARPCATGETGPDVTRGLEAWLDARPGARAHVAGLGHHVRTTHPRAIMSCCLPHL